MRKTYLWATLLLSLGLCGLSLTSCINTGNKGNQKIDGHEAVDLGLSVKWATCNIGASSPEEYGGYYAWGETDEKEIYNDSTYKHCNGSSFKTLTKYCMESSYGIVDNKTVLDPEDDVAQVKWGGGWRMPTRQEINELLDNCSWTWSTQNGVKGYIVMSKVNGNSIFLPGAGHRIADNVFYKECGYYWSVSLDDEGFSSSAFDLNFGWSYQTLNKFNRSHGFSVRPVTE
jgi:non-specific serine/threonine protein kinase